MRTLAELTVDQLRRAVQLKEQINNLERQLEALTGSQSFRPAAGLLARRPSTISPAGRARIVEAQRRRWARVRAAQGAEGKKPAAQPMRRLSPEGRAKIVAAARARWARERGHS